MQSSYEREDISIYMRINKKVCTINIQTVKTNILLFFVCLNFLIPYYFSEILANYPYINLLLSLISILFMLILIWGNPIRISFPLIWLVMQYGSLIISSKLNHSSTYTAIINSVLVVLLCLTIDVFIRDKNKTYIFLTFVRNMVLFFFVINLIITLIMPQGIPSITLRNSPYFLYGNVNTTIKYIFPGLCCSLIIDDKRNKISFSTIVFIIGMLYLNFNIYFMATAFIGLFVVVFWFLFRNYIIREPRLFYIGVIAAVLFVQVFIIMNNSDNFVTRLITSIFGKDLTFSGRNILWTRALNAIQSQIEWGYGLLDSVSIYKLIGNTAGAHNYYLDLVFQRGLIGFTIFISIFVYILFKLRKNIQTTTCIILGFICAYFLMFLSEPFYSVEKFHIPLIYCLAILVKRKKNNT